ncbi:MAG: hypothetical protein R3C59_21190 [Planctomycetaceae bacterium]
MCITTTTPRDEILERSQNYKRELRFDLTAEEYLTSTRMRCETLEYERKREPLVPADPYEITPAQLTMNPYNSLVLNSPNMFIADIDKGDPRFSPFATVADEEEILESLNSLGDFDAEFEREEPIRDASWRLYGTHSGYRLICTSRPIGQEEMWYARKLLRFFRADPRYIDLCEKQKCFRARLTPKPWRGQELCNSVCYLIEECGDEVHPAIAEQLRLHDELTIFSSDGLA